MILVPWKTNKNNNQRNPSKAKNIFCSISSKVADYSETEPFTLDRIRPQHCTHLLIDHRSSLLSASISDQLKLINPEWKILLTFDADENADIDQWKKEINEKKADGINVLIDSNKFSSKITQFIKVIFGNEITHSFIHSSHFRRFLRPCPTTT